jgi:hypothetical protein
MKSFVSTVFVGLALAGGLTACATNEPFDPSDVKVSVDSAVYHLRPMQNNAWYQINLTVTVVNDKPYDVFVSQECGSWHLGRADGSDKPYLYLGSYACFEGSKVAPMILAPGEQFSRSFRLTGSNSSDTRPPITIENNTGTLVFEYVLTDPDGIPVGRARSAPFLVEPPAN